MRTPISKLKVDPLALENAECFARAVHETWPDAEIRLFGLQTRGQAGYNSDVDIAVILDTEQLYPAGDYTDEEFADHIFWVYGIIGGASDCELFEIEPHLVERGKGPAYWLKETSDGILLDAPAEQQPEKLVAENYTFRLAWSEEDDEYIATCEEFPYLSDVNPNPRLALAAIIELIDNVIEELYLEGLEPPEPKHAHR